VKTKAGKKVLNDATQDEQEIIKELKELALEFKTLNFKGEAGEQRLYQLLRRVKSYKDQLDSIQEYPFMASFLEGFLGDK